MSDFVRKREELRARAQSIVLELKTSSTLRDLLQKRLGGTLGRLEPNALVEMRPREEPKGIFSGRRWVGPCSVIAHEGRLAWLRFPDGTARLVHRHRVRPLTEDSRIVVQLQEAAQERMLWPRDCDLQTPHEADDDVEADPCQPGADDVPLEVVSDGEPRTPPDVPAQPLLSGARGIAELGRSNPAPDETQHEKRDDDGRPERPAVGEETGAQAPRGGLQRRESDLVHARYEERRAKRHKAGSAEASYLDDCYVEEVGGAPPSGSAFSGVEVGSSGGRGLQDSAEVVQAKTLEWQQWEANDVFQWVPLESQPITRPRWVLTKKDREDGSKTVKARLCAQGTLAQDHQRPELLTESPTVSRLAIRATLAQAASRGWSVNAFDVSAAFLQGDPSGSGRDSEKLFGVVGRDIYLKPPPEFAREGFVMKLLKVPYGFADAPRRWFVAADRELRKIGFEPSVVDPAAFVLRADGAVRAIVCLHVDDGLFAGDALGLEAVERFTKRFRVGKVSIDNFTYLGVNITRGEDGSIVESQADYVHRLRPVMLGDSRASDKSAPLTSLETRELRGLLGALQWLASVTRPDISVDVSLLQRAFHGPVVADVLRANKLLRRVKATDHVVVRYEPLGPPGASKLVVFTDAALQNAPDAEDPAVKVWSQGGHVVMEVETRDGSLVERPKFNVLAWSSRKIRRVCRSSFAAEALEACAAADMAVVSRVLWQEFTGVSADCYLVTDSLNLRDHVRCLANNTTEKRLKVDLFALKEYFRSDDITGLLWVDGADNPADSLTKTSPILQRMLDDGRLDLSTLL